jgi:dolichol-phosphate mannosyltransferase
MKVSIVLPTYNEKGNIRPLIEAIIRNLEGEFEVIVVDDDSPDGTGEEVELLGRSDPRIRLLRRTGKRGLTASLREGIAAARHDYVIWMDADFAHPPALLPAMIGESAQFDIVVASRYVAGGQDGRGSLLRRGVSLLLNRISARLAQSSVRDLSSGFLRVKKPVFDRIPLQGEYGDYCIDFLICAEKAGYRIKEIPFTNADREEGYSKTTTSPLIFFRYALIYVRALLKLRKNNYRLRKNHD